MRNRICSMLAGAFLASVAPADVKYRAQRMPAVPGGQGFTGVSDVNNYGIACGTRSGVEFNSTRAVIWQPDTGEIEELQPGYCSLFRSAALFITDAGHVIGTQGPTCPNEHWLWTPDDGFRIVDEFPEAETTELRAINIHDTLIGVSYFASGGGRAFTWSPESGIAALNHSPFDINDNGWMVGRSYVWDPEVGLIALGSLPGMDGVSLTGSAVNNQNQVLGSGRYEGQYLPFIWSQTGRTRWLPVPFNHPTAGGTARSFSDWPPGYDEPIVFGDAAYFDETIEDWVTSRCLWRPGRLPQLVGPDSIDPCETDWAVVAALDRIAIRGPNIRGQFFDTLYYPPFPERWVGIVLTPYIPGDLDEDADCDLQDLAYQLSNFGRTGDATYAAGDLDCDQDVDLQDLSTLLANFGETLP